MNKLTRIQKIQEIIDRDKDDPFGKLEIPWEDKLEPMNVYKIPLEYLVYNKYNGRILSRTQSLENQKQKIDAETEEGKALIEQLLWDSKPDRNKKTLISISNFGQEKVGIITRDGIIIDGNRRAMLLNRSGKFDYFKTVVLDVTSEENPIEIEKLETSYQMGEDEKLGYNPVEKYLKVKGLYTKLSNKKFKATEIDKKSVKKISDWMGETEPVIEDYLVVMETMDDYLDYLEYNGIYTQLDGREDQFISLTKWLSNFYGEQSSKAFDGYRDDDVDDLKLIAYDYIRIKYEGKKFRYLGHGLKANHFFGEKKIWVDFRDVHFDNKEKIFEEPVDRNSKNLERHLNDRDNKFYEETKFGGPESFMDENVDSHYQQLRYNQASGEPEKLVKTAKKALLSINQKHKSFSTPEVLSEVEELSSFVTNMLQTKSTSKLLNHVLGLLQTVKVTNKDDKEEICNRLKDIQSIAYNIGKDIKKGC